MDRASAEALHEKASQHYLSGEFAEALATWEALLRLDPADERALEGTRLSAMMVGPEVASFTIDRAPLEAAASRTPAPAPRAAVLPDPNRQAEGIDFGDVAAIAPLPLGRVDDAIDAALGPLGGAPARSGGSLDDLLAMDLEAEPSAGGEDVADTALAPFQTAAHPAAPAAAERTGPPAAQGELSRRLGELLTQARAAAEAGSLDEARALLARVTVLDEDNAEAQALQDHLRAKEQDGLRQIDDWIVEGVQWFEQGRHVEARGNFQRVLEAMPDHLEAQDYLRRIDEAAAAASAPPAVPSDAPAVDEDFLASLTSASTGEAPQLEAVPLQSPSPRSRPPAPLPAPVAGPAPVARKRVSPLAMVAAVAAVAAAGWFFLRPKGEASDIPHSALTAERPAAGAKKRAAPAATPATATIPDLSPPARPAGDPEKRIAEATAKGDWPAAIVAYNEILAAHPDDVVARAGLLEAAQRYREQKAQNEQLLQARRAFADGEYEAALRLLYRMPRTADAAALESAKVAGWVNLGIVALKAAEPDKAITQLDEALALRPQDQEAQHLKTFAEDSVKRPKDQAYYARVEAMEFRTLPD